MIKIFASRLLVLKLVLLRTTYHHHHYHHFHSSKFESRSRLRQLELNRYHAFICIFSSSRICHILCPKENLNNKIHKNSLTRCYVKFSFLRLPFGHFIWDKHGTKNSFWFSEQSYKTHDGTRSNHPWKYFLDAANHLPLMSHVH